MFGEKSLPYRGAFFCLLLCPWIIRAGTDTWIPQLFVGNSTPLSVIFADMNAIDIKECYIPVNE
jgi:hypothetical protein